MEENAGYTDARVKVKVCAAPSHHAVQHCKHLLKHSAVALEEALGACLEHLALYCYFQGLVTGGCTEHLLPIRGKEGGALLYIKAPCGDCTSTTASQEPVKSGAAGVAAGGAEHRV